ncbi:unnamed protein product [Enterobius vermicularis]|uniref:Uncharacterized protein n=1 Tax=Enterobius vermicularis TaxID=51028 RepID=A0A0N4VGP3_ENTVE|nr:unnamed protein product [Enterobius vermicularis]
MINAPAGNQTRATRVAGEHSTTEPPTLAMRSGFSRRTLIAVQMADVSRSLSYYFKNVKNLFFGVFKQYFAFLYRMCADGIIIKDAAFKFVKT